MGVGPRLFFQRVPETKLVKNRLHLDVRVGTGLVGAERLAALEAECARLVALGAVRVRLLPADGGNESCLVMQDVEGNEFPVRTRHGRRGKDSPRDEPQECSMARRMPTALSVPARTIPGVP